MTAARTMFEPRLSARFGNVDHHPPIAIDPDDPLAVHPPHLRRARADLHFLGPTDDLPVYAKPIDPMQEFHRSMMMAVLKPSVLDDLTTRLRHELGLVRYAAS
jgi:hypothetical protein